MIDIRKPYLVIITNRVIRVLKREIHRYDDVLTINDLWFARDTALDEDRSAWDWDFIRKEAYKSVD